MRRSTRVLSLPGAAGDPDFWGPVAERLPADWATIRLAWPGVGPADPAVRGFDDPVGRTTSPAIRRRPSPA